MSENPLGHFERRNDFLVAIDSDGCAFDTMEVKHKECFIPNTINFFDLQAVSKYAREAAEFVNLYSKWRGVNRFPALTMTMDLLRDRPEVQAREVDIPELSSVKEWIDNETKLGMPALNSLVEEGADADLQRTCDWSKAVNETVDEFVHGVPPFPFLRESLERLQPSVDMIVCSATPNGALQKEWQEHDIAKYVGAICGQESGSKAESLAAALELGYAPDKMLMIGDAPGDMNAAKKVGVLFYPINPGAEDGSWKRFHEEACDKFLNGTYAGDYESAVIAEFDEYLPENPPWKS